MQRSKRAYSCNTLISFILSMYNYFSINVVLPLPQCLSYLVIFCTIECVQFHYQSYTINQYQLYLFIILIPKFHSCESKFLHSDCSDQVWQLAGPSAIGSTPVHLWNLTFNDQLVTNSIHRRNLYFAKATIFYFQKEHDPQQHLLISDKHIWSD